MRALSTLGIIGGAALFLTATPFSLQLSQKNVTLSLDTADARVVRPVTRVGVRGVGWRSYAAYRSYGYGAGWRYGALRRAAVLGAAAYGYGAYSGYGYPAYSSYAYDSASYNSYSSPSYSYASYYSPSYAYATYYRKPYFGFAGRWW